MTAEKLIEEVRKALSWVGYSPNTAEWTRAKDAETAALAALSEIETILNEQERDLRQEWWVNHGHGFGPQYGDDGEMQCASGVHGVIDFKREPIEDLRAKVTAARLVSYGAGSRALQGSDTA